MGGSPRVFEVGERFSRLIVIARRMPVGKPLVRCRCDCGAITSVQASHLVSGHTTSCGCQQRDGTVARNLKHGQAGRTTEYRSWTAMLRRCENPNTDDWPRYGGRGIRVCARWHEFVNFYADMGRKPGPKYSIDRLDNDRDYEPDNCQWATPKQQARNKLQPQRQEACGRGHRYEPGSYRVYQRKDGYEQWDCIECQRIRDGKRPGRTAYSGRGASGTVGVVR